jgi:hypothetical protein
MDVETGGGGSGGTEKLKNRIAKTGEAGTGA